MNSLNEILKEINNNVKIENPVLKSCYLTLINNHKAISYFQNSKYKDDNNGEKILRLYGMLQSLFVCIDALYTLSYKITSSKNFISINDNKILRELKYIRNDVVGHPTNRIVDDHEEYACLYEEDITNDEFSYHIYFNDSKVRNIKYNDLIDAYKKEAYTFLYSIKEYIKSASTPDLYDDIITIYKSFINGENIRCHLKLFKKTYGMNNTSTRVFKKIKLLLRLNDDYIKNSDETYYYLISYHLYKLASMIVINENISNEIKIVKLPNSLEKIVNYFKVNKQLFHYINNLYDINHPLFYSSLERILKSSRKNKNKTIENYFLKIKEYSKKKDSEYVYAFTSILKDIK